MLEEDRHLLQRAAVETLDRIRREGRKASHRVQPILAYIEAHLFDPKLSVKRLRKECRIRDNSILTRFHRELGRPPYGYIVDRRMEVAQQLLRVTDLQIWKIASLLGYGSLPTFSHAFLSWARVRPRVYRERVRRLLPREDRETRTRVTRATLEDCLRRARERFFNETRADSQSSPLRIDGLIFEQLAAEEIWSLLRDLPEEEQQVLVRERVRFRSTALFELLREKSRSAGRGERRRGVAVAKLALESLHGSSEAFGERLPSLEARAWAWIGNAERLAMDFAAAEQSFDRAEATWKLAGPSEEPLVLGEILQNKAALRWFQRRFQEALSLVGRAVPIFREHAEPRLLAQLIVIHANILLFADRLAAARDALEKAFRIESSLGDVYLSLSAYSTLTNIHIAEGESAAAAESLELFKQLAASLSNPIPDHQIRWTEGLVLDTLGDPSAAEASLEAACSGFEEHGEWLQAATVALDLALLCARRGRPEEMATHAARARALFSSLGIERESLMSARLWTEALQKQSLEAPLLRRLRKRLASVTRMPQSS